MEAILYLYVDKSIPGLYEHYQKHVESHNYHIDTNLFPNSGFDIFVPEDQFISHDPLTSYFLDFKIKTEMRFKRTPDAQKVPTAFQVYARSSLSKTPLILSNHVGIIDSGYRGNIKGAFRSVNNIDQYYVQKFTRLVQICHPSLCKIRVILVEDENDLSSTERGEKGFGSSGV